MRYVMGLDVGTSGTKTVLVDERGAVVASRTGDYPMLQPQPGWAEQHPDDWWRAARDTIAGVLRDSGVAAADVKAIGLCGQMHSLVLLDEHDEVVRPAILWCDQRTEQQCIELTRLVGAERLLAITANPALTGFTAGKILWVRDNEPDNYARVRHMMLAKDYVRYKLTGERATDVSDASGMQLLDVGARQWSRELLDLLNIDESMLCKVYESEDITGYVTDEAAALTGLAPGTPVVAGAGDNAAAAIGTGTVRDGRAFTTIGSSGVVFAHTSDMHIDPKGRVHTFCCAVRGAWHVMGVTQAAGMSLQWFRNELCPDVKEQAKAQGVSSYALLDDIADERPIGANGVLYLPYLMGERTPHLDPMARGVFFGLSGATTRADMLRAVLEGVGYSLLDCLSVLREMGLTVDDMLACGGGGSSALWRHMLADMFGCPVGVLASNEGAVYGACLLAMVGAGIHPDVVAACDAALGDAQTVQPDPARGAQYLAGYDRFKALYGALQPIYRL